MKLYFSHLKMAWGWALKLAKFGNKMVGKAAADVEAGKRTLKTGREMAKEPEFVNPTAQILSNHLGLASPRERSSSFLDRASTFNNTSKYGGAIQPDYDSDDGGPPVPQFRFRNRR
jgi:hypothetical protein